MTDDTGSAELMWTNRPDRETAAALHEKLATLRIDLERMFERFQELERFCSARANSDAVSLFSNLAAEFPERR